MGDDDNGFSQGVAYAAAEMERCFGQTTYALHLLEAAGLTTLDALKYRKVDPYDRKACLKALRQHKPKPSRPRKEDESQ